MAQKDYTIPPTYTLYGYTVTFSPETWAYRRLAKRARGLVNSETKAYVKAFTENLSEQYFEDRRERLRDSVEKIAEPIVDLLHEYHKDDYSVRSYVDQCMSTLGDDLDDLNDRIQERYEDIADDADKLSAYNENLKQQKYMYNSVVHDSILERMTANAGVAMSAKTQAGQIDSAVSKRREALINRYRDKLEDCVYTTLSNTIHPAMKLLNCTRPDTKADPAELHKLAELPDHGCEQAVQLLGQYPYREDIYAYLLENFGDPDGTLEKIGNVFERGVGSQKAGYLKKLENATESKNYEEAEQAVTAYVQACKRLNCEPKEEVLNKLQGKRDERFKEACTFRGTTYASIAEKEQAEVRFANAKSQAGKDEKEIDAQIEKLFFGYEEEDYQIAKKLHDKLEEKYMGQMRTTAMIKLKQYLYLCEWYKSYASGEKKGNAAGLVLSFVVVLAVLSVMTLLKPGFIIGLIAAVATCFGSYCFLDSYANYRNAELSKTMWETGKTYEYNAAMAYKEEGAGKLSFKNTKENSYMESGGATAVFLALLILSFFVLVVS